nr:hypothetical protein GCM10020063_069470 [Dactylosporangium thailandense]
MKSAAAALAALTTVLIGAPAFAEPVGVIQDEGPNAVPGRYIVTLKQADRTDRLIQQYGGQTRHRSAGWYSTAMSEAQARRLAADPGVASVEAVQRITVQDTQSSPPNWGDDRIDQAALPLNQRYEYPASAGQGVTVYVLDTGINAGHVEFSGRVRQGVDIVDNDSSPADCHGHGTHVAGTAVGTSYGVAKTRGSSSCRRPATTATTPATTARRGSRPP